METKHKKPKWLIQIALIFLIFFVSKAYSQVESQNYCYYLTGASLPDPGNFSMGACSPSSSLRVTCTSGSGNFPADLQFNVIVSDTSAGGCGTALNQLMSAAVFSNNISKTFPINCSPQNAPYFIQVSGISCNSSVPMQYTFKFEIVATSGNTVCSDETVGFTFNILQLTSNAPAGLFYVCPTTQPVAVTVGGLNGDYDIEWYTSAGSNVSSTNPATITTAGQYTVKIKLSTTDEFDNAACNNYQHNLTITNGTAPSVTGSANSQPICPGQPILLGATGASVYIWKANGVTTGTNYDTLTEHPLVTTIYSVIGYNGSECPSYPPYPVTVNVLPAVNFSISSSATQVCPGAPAVLFVPAQSGVTYLWSTGSTVNSITVMPTQTTSYSVTEIENGCSATKSITINVINPVPAEIGIGSAPTSSVNTIYQCELGSSSAVFTAINPASSYNWSLSGNGATYSIISNTQGSSVSVNLAGQTGTGNVLLTLTTYSSGCTGSVTTLTILPCCTTPAGFTQLGAYSGQNMGSASVLNAGTYTGTYLVSGKLLLTGNVTFNGATLEMNPGASIVGGGNLTLNNTHIYACSGMWQGISFINDLTNGGALNNTPVLSVTNSLIEDAIYAANIVNPNAVNGSTNDGATNVSASFSNAWFNRCAVGIANNFDPLTPVAVLYNTDTVYHSGTINTLSNCVFTCRNGVTMAMVTANNTAALANLAGGALHNYLRTNLNYNAFTGIATDVSALPNSTISTCFFDNVMDGILATGEGSALKVTNCTFQYNNVSPVLPNYAFVNNGNYCKGQAGGNLGGAPGTFVFHSLTGTGATRAGAGINFFGASLVVGGTTATACSVLNSDYGLISYSNLTVTANKFTGTNNAGVYVNTMNPYGNVENPSGAYAINNNTFTNHYRQGVNAIFMNPAAGSSLGINNNTFTVSTALYATKAAATYTALPEAISVTGSAQGNSFVSIENNNISNYQLGITALGTYSVNIGTNSISMYDDNVNNTTYTHGISLVNSNGSIVLNNTISASYAAAALKNEQFGIFTTASTNSLIECNHISGPDVSIKCQGPNNISTLANNSFLNAALINFWLELSGNVGPQGVAAGGVSGGITYPKGYSNANIFSNTGSIANGEKPVAAFCSNGSNTPPNGLSPFYYANVSIQTPSPSTDDQPSGGKGTALPLGGIYQLGTSPPAATTCPSGGRLANTNNDPVLTSAVSPASALPPILNGNTPYLIAGNALHAALYDTVACFGNVHDLYRTLLEQGAAYYTADAVLSKFMLTMQGSVHEKLVAADSLLLHAADSTEVNAALLHNNSFTAQGMHDKYLQAVNNLFAAALKQKHGLSATQMQNLKSIARLCPYQFGEGVFRARALLSRYDDTKYINTCEQPAFPQKPSAIAREETIDGATLLLTAKVSIFPNPNSGSFNISYTGTAKSVSIEVYNTLGALVASQSIANENETSVTQISNLPEGVYMVRLNGDGVPVKIERIIVTK